MDNSIISNQNQVHICQKQTCIKFVGLPALLVTIVLIVLALIWLQDNK